MNEKKTLLARMRDGEALGFGEQLSMIVRLSIPAILAQISAIIMQYIDASMVGRLGANDSAAIGLVSSTTWLFYGIGNAASVGFSVQIAKKIGAKNEEGARNDVKVGLLLTTLFSLLLLAIGTALSFGLPWWLGGDAAVAPKAAVYFRIFALSLTFVQLNTTALNMLEASGNMRFSGLMQIILCLLDMVYNALLIFPTSVHSLFGLRFMLPGAGLGIAGAALGTALSEVTVSLIMLWYLLFRSEQLRLRRGERMRFRPEELRQSVKIAFPVAMEQFVTCTAYIAFTRIVSPLGTAAIAANSFSITAESLCYMPGYGISAAATTVIGQSIGAKRADLTKRLGRLSTFLGVAIMTVTGVAMYFLAPLMLGVLTPDLDIQRMGAEILRIEAFAEPMYAASIIATGVFRGAGDTVVPTVLNLISMWLVRIPLAFVLSLSLGLRGVWIAMCIELCVRGVLFIILMETRFRKRADKGLYVK